MIVNSGHDESRVLLRQVESRLETLRAFRHHSAVGGASLVGFTDRDIAHAEEIADRLRLLVAQTSQSSAGERARVRAAVHYFVGLHRGHGHNNHGHNGHGRDRRRQRSLAEELRVVSDMVRQLGDGMRAA